MESPRILIVEDEPKVAAFIKKGLVENGFSATVALDGQDGKMLAMTEVFDLIILDINLPHINGFQLCQIIRKHNQKVCILMLTASGGLDDKVKGFGAGADDYLLKPFEFMELLVRIKALLKRNNVSAQPQNIIKIDDLEVNRDTRRVKRGGKDIDLTVKEYTLLEYLITNRGRIIPRTELLENVWSVNFDTGTNVVEVYINFLRKKMDSNFATKIIQTKVGHGYFIH